MVLKAGAPDIVQRPNWNLDPVPERVAPSAIPMT
jgi:hypothetical protein